MVETLRLFARFSVRVEALCAFFMGFLELCRIFSGLVKRDSRRKELRRVCKLLQVANMKLNAR